MDGATAFRSGVVVSRQLKFKPGSVRPVCVYFERAQRPVSGRIGAAQSSNVNGGCGARPTKLQLPSQVLAHSPVFHLQPNHSQSKRGRGTGRATTVAPARPEFRLILLPLAVVRIATLAAYPTPATSVIVLDPLNNRWRRVRPNFHLINLAP
ncbi:hypothetical protein N656DRAFT_589758 [Canariomyces notabilis]|uniref:Uncharacterized protein n=1 Tax=Canariomyces notabilis TaxID=2074819 RepID=A0AAN6TH85_9PEZI|nr:hypothetical protein N656DRAFT_589758 [Canariomyces arenarius]